MKVAAVSGISEQIRGVTYAKSDASAVPRSGYSPMLRANNIGEHGLVLEDLIFVPNTKISPKQRIIPNDIVVAASSGSISVVGKTAQARIGFDGGFGAFCKVLRPGPDVDPHYFGHYFKTSSYRRVVSQLASGANIKNLKNEHLDNLLIPLPPLPEQKRIAGILDAADALRAKRREALAQLDTLIQSTFLDMFGDPVINPMGWEMVNGGRVSRRLTVGIVVKPASYYQPTGVPAIRSLNVRTNKIEIASLVYVSAENNEGRLKKTRVWKDDVLLVRSGQPGTAAVVPAELDGVNAIDILILTPDQHVAHPVYLSNYFNSAGGKRMVLGAQRGQIQKHLNVGSLRSAPIPLPPLDLQCRFAAIVESVEHQKASQRAHLAEVNTLFAALQSRAFRGDL